MDKEKIKQAIKQIIEAIGGDTIKLQTTPQKVADMYEVIFAGIQQQPKINPIPTTNKDLITLKDIKFYSICEHHLLPFFGTVEITYKPNKNIASFGSLTRTIEILSKKPQLQETLTAEIADTIMNQLNPQGIIVKATARHMCMEMKGKQAKITTEAKRGII